MKYLCERILPGLLGIVLSKFLGIWFIAAAALGYVFIFLPIMAVISIASCEEDPVVKSDLLLLLPPRRLIPNTDEYMNRFMPKA